MFQIRSGKAGLGPNRVTNPGFEQGDGGEHPEGPEWAPAQIQGWSLWPAASKPGLSLSTHDRHEGKRSARIANVREGVLISTIKGMKEGELYYVSLWAKCLPPKQGEVKSKVALTVQWLNEKNAWWRFGANTFTAELQQMSEWEKLEAIALVPKGPVAAALLLSASGLDDGQAVHFDEVSVSKITLR